MKKFILHTIYFSIVFILINLVFYFGIVKPALFEKYIYNEKHISNYNLVLVSDSHGAYFQNTPNEYGIFNLSYPSDNYHDMYLKIKYFSKFLSSEDTILLSIDNHQLSSYRSGLGNIEKNIIYYDDVSEIDSSYANIKDYYIKYYTKYLSFFNVDINNDITKYLYISLGVDGLVTKTHTINQLDSLTLNRNCKKRYKTQFKDKIKSKQQVKYLKKIIALCRENNIILIGIKFPITENYWRLIENEDFGMEALLVEGNIKILDLHDLLFSQNEYFTDQDHLNTLGAKLFCKEITRIDAY